MFEATLKEEDQKKKRWKRSAGLGMELEIIIE